MSRQVSVLFYPDVEQTRPLVQCLFQALTHLPSSSFQVVKVPIIHSLSHESVDLIDSDLPAPRRLFDSGERVAIAHDLDCSAAVFYICPKFLDLRDRLLIKHFQFTLDVRGFGTVWVALDSQPSHHFWRKHGLQEVDRLRSRFRGSPYCLSNGINAAALNQLSHHGILLAQMLKSHIALNWYSRLGGRSKRDRLCPPSCAHQTLPPHGVTRRLKPLLYEFHGS
jgi:hypothetical protein